MNIAIIGHEERKFTPLTYHLAYLKILQIVGENWNESHLLILTIVSGRCHLGGVDIWAEDAAARCALPTQIFPPEVLAWDPQGKIGFKRRNIQIAEAADRIYVIVVERLPKDYPVESWNAGGGCYHCAKRSYRQPNGEPIRAHVKSGACWTAWYAIEKLQKPARWEVI